MNVNHDGGIRLRAIILANNFDVVEGLLESFVAIVSSIFELLTVFDIFIKK